ncbi:hypothetical protein BC835DRAFT_1415229 [Cytidiella melzeri]|nr:hypothetical protein BC835DRAFT_1415229 [Cytidiella melzeri]
MSNSSANNYSDADIAVLQAIRTDNYINVALLAVAVYEYAITFLQEAEAISSFLQRGKNSAPAAALFLANRYVGLLYGVVGFIAGVIPTASVLALLNGVAS